MRSWPLLGVLALGVGCPRGAPPSGAEMMPAGTRQWAPPPNVIEYTRVNRAGSLALPEVRVRNEWRGPELVDGHIHYDIASWDITSGSPTRIDVTRAFYGPEGFGWVGTLDEDGVLEPWEPKQLVLPAEPEVGDTWSATHEKGDIVSVRSCEILASDLCEGGLVSVCDSQRDDGRIVLRDHFCPGVGWSGFEALVVGADRPDVRMWTRSVVRDGVRLPSPD